MKVRAILTLKNEVLVSARERLGLTQQAAAEKAGVPATFVQAVERFRRSHGRDGRPSWSDATFIAHLRKLATALELTENDLAFDEMLGIDLESVSVVKDVPAKALLAFSDRVQQRLALPAETAATTEELREALEKAMKKLKPIEQKCIRLRAEGYTLDEIGAQVKRTREGVRGIILKSMKRLQHPNTSRQLEGFL